MSGIILDFKQSEGSIGLTMTRFFSFRKHFLGRLNVSKITFKSVFDGEFCII